MPADVPRVLRAMLLDRAYTAGYERGLHDSDELAVLRREHMRLRARYDALQADALCERPPTDEDA